MKTVRLSGSLLHDIRSNIKNAFARVNPEKEYPSDEGLQVLERQGIVEKIEQTRLHLEELWGDGYLVKERTCEGITISCEVDTNVDDDGHMQTEKRSYNLNVPSMKVPAFLLGESYYDSRLDVWVPSDDPTFVKCQEVRMFNEDRHQKREDQIRQFNNLIEEHDITTLNQLLKAAPWLEAHVPADRLQKMNEKDERVKREQRQREYADDAMSDIRETLLEDKLTGDIFNE